MKKFFKKEQVDILLIDQPTLVGLERILNPKIVVYRATDLYYEMTGDKDILKAEQVIISNVNAIIGTSQPVYNYLKD